MSLSRDDFATFFRALHDGYEPFAWQERLLDELLTTGAWPDRIVAPTGAGKTAAIDIHAFAVALTAGLDQPRLPRRLVMVVGRRVLVDDQYEHARRIADELAHPQDPTLAEVAARLRELRGPTSASATGDDDASPLLVARLRGGTALSRDWRDHPAACAIICATPDMWGSRLLFRGYGSARRARPREAGLLALDAAVVVDEAHLSRQLLTTARQVGRLVSVADEPLPLPALQTVETTATPSGGDAAGRSVGVADQDLAGEPVLRDRLTRPKPVTLVPAKDWPPANASQRQSIAGLIAEEVVGLLAASIPDAATPHTVGCYTNTVGMVVEVARELRKRRRPDGAPLVVVTVCGQARPADLIRLRREHPGVLGVSGSPDVDVLLTTQSLEVGVDLDLAGVVTELAPGSALAQRAGRVNRRGLRPTGHLRIVAPDGNLTERSRSGPYLLDELGPALEWVYRRAADPAGMAPWTLRDDPPPPAARHRMLYQRPQMGDAWHWGRTGDELAAEPQLDLWLAESFEEESSVGIVVRDATPDDANAAVSLTRLLPPTEREVFTVPLGAARAVLAIALGGDDGPDGLAQRPVVRLRNNDIVVVDRDKIDIRPGDLFVIDSRTPAFTPSTAGYLDGFSPPVPLLFDDRDGVSASTAADVLHDIPSPQAGQVVLRLEPAVWSAPEVITGLLKEYVEQADGAPESECRATLRRLLQRVSADLAQDSGPALIKAAIDLVRGPVRNSEVALHVDEQGSPIRLVLVDKRRAWSDELLRQVWLPRDTPVPLDEHQAAVAERVAWFGRGLRLPAELTEALRMAGLHHDDGKADRRFQAGLGAVEVPLAKSGGLSLTEFRRRAYEAGLPERWRHEQRSVVDSWEPIRAAMPEPYAQLASRLVGTSHGHGRSGFPHAAAELLHGLDDHRELAEELFDRGAWDTLLERTERRWGVWGCAYLEALLRAADGTVSGEGT